MRVNPLGKAAIALLVCAGSIMPSLATSPIVTPPTLGIAPAPLTPYSSGGCWNEQYPCYRASGVADPGALITLVVRDETNSGYAIRTQTYATKQSDAGSGIPAGTWAASPNVTDLGTHVSDPSNLIFTATAQDAAGTESAPTILSVGKQAATEGDTVGPVVRPQTAPYGWPPPMWSRECLGDCQPPEGRGCLFTPMGCSGYARVQGSVIDDFEGAFGVASEIADVVITITKSSDQEVVRVLRSFTRRGTRAFYGATLFIGDYDMLTSYDIYIQAFDAAGNAGLIEASGFTVIP